MLFVQGSSSSDPLTDRSAINGSRRRFDKLARNFAAALTLTNLDLSLVPAIAKFERRDAGWPGTGSSLTSQMRRVPEGTVVDRIDA